MEDKLEKFIIIRYLYRKLNDDKRENLYEDYVYTLTAN